MDAATPIADIRTEPFDLFAAPLRGAGLIEASAGTGKTWTITGLFLRLLVEEGYSAEQILVVTYTKAATAELRERIRGRLSEALGCMTGGDSGDEFCKRLRARALERGQRELAARRLRRAIRNFDEAAVFTIHGFCQRVLTESAFESGVAFETELAPDETALLQEVVDDFWRRETASASPLWSRHLADKGQTPDAWRKAVRSHLEKPYLELAPLPDLGDDNAMETAFEQAFLRARQIWRAEGPDIARRLTEAAAGKQLKNNSYPPAGLTLWFAEFDEYFSRDEAETKYPAKLVKLGTAELAKGASVKNVPPAHPFFDVCSKLVEAAEVLAEAYRLKLIGLQLRLIRECNAELPRRKSGLGLMFYSDLLNRLADALQGREGRLLAETLRERYRAALIDEFQDTDPVQYGIFQGIYGEAEQPVFFVGDPKQAIYGFRGADIFSYLQARRNTDAHYTLAVNHRSAPELIEAVNALFARSANPFLLSDIRFSQVRPADKARPRLVVEDDGEEPLRFMLAEAEGKALTKEFANAQAAGSTATEIVRLLNLAAAGKAWLEEPLSAGDSPDWKSRPLHGGDIAVLAPTHRQGEQIQAELAVRGVASVRQGQDDVFATLEAVELERLLLAIAEPREEGRIRTALATGLMGFDAAGLLALQSDESAWENWLRGFARYREIWIGRGFMAMFRLWLEEKGVVGRLLPCRDGERRLTNLLHLSELLQLESGNKPLPEGLMGWFSRAVSAPEGGDEFLLRLESDASRVKIVTIHTSKGLEYPIVFCPFQWDGKLWNQGESAALFHDPQNGLQPVLDLGGADYPAHYALASREKLAEKLRLLYVALTRAKHRCHLVWGYVSGMESSALAWLLHGPGAAVDDPLAAMKSICAGLDHAAVKAVLAEFAAGAPGAVAVAPLTVDQNRHAPAVETEQVLAARAFARPYLRPDWRMTSFSALARGRHSESPDYDPPEAAVEATPPRPGLFGFPRGAGAGRCLHGILEEWDLASGDYAALARLVRRKLKAHAIDEAWTDDVAAAVRATVAADLDGKGLKLMNIRAGQRLAELEFTYPLRHLDLHGLKTLLADPRLGLPPAFAEAAKSLAFETVGGYMKGFIDLAFEDRGRYYLLDYKSNWLGPAPLDYAPERLLPAMAREHYYLQYLIYALALHRYLKMRLPDYDYGRHFGGAYYLFLRGVGYGEPERCGVFHDRPRPELIESLDALMSWGTIKR